MTSRILLADDSITIQKVVNLTFADEGIEVVAVSNGEQAERRLSEISPDLVLADIFMPGKNGYELCEFVKQSPQFRNVPVVLLVGAFEPFNEAEARRVRADAHLTKPFESRTLVDTVRKLIGMSGRPAGAPPSVPMPTHQEAPALTPAPEATSVALPSFNLDLSGMSPEWEANQPGQQSNPIGDSAEPAQLNNASPLELDYGSFGNSDNAPTGFQVEERATSAGFSFTSSVKDTAELPPIEPEPPASVHSQQWAPTEPMQESPVFSEGEPTLARGDSFSAPFELADDSQGFKVRSTFGDADRDSVLDFDRMDAPQSSAPDNIVSFDVDFSTATTSETPVAYDAPTAASEEQPTERSMSEEPATAAVDAEEFGEMPLELTAEPIPQTLSVDDPLGDVLSVEPSDLQPIESGVNGGMAPLSFQPPEPAEFVSASEPEVVEEPPALSPYAFDEDSARGTNERLGGVVHSGLSFEAFSPVMEEPASARTEPSVWESSSEDVLPELSQTVETPSEVENAFAASEMWAAAETEFAAIDVEAVAVDEPALSVLSESPDPETGFAFASVAEPPAEAPAPVESMPAPAESNTQPGESVMLSQALIDEIVRRVVAEMGDAVVREIAWEVVPDCVERVVEKLSHDAAAKRM
jgi:CheY-like chemotaxis protein